MLHDLHKNFSQDGPKRIVFFGMSGLGKTHLSLILARDPNWHHDSVDLRIGSNHLAADIDQSLADQGLDPNTHPMAAQNVRPDDLAPVSHFLGKPGDADLGGSSIAAFRARQKQFEIAEIAALLEVPQLIQDTAAPNFVCDTGGSFCEWVDPHDPNDAILSALSEVAVLVWLEGTDAHIDRLVERFSAAPKPMAYRPDFLDRMWARYSEDHAHIDPDAFVRYTYRHAMDHRQPLYRDIADKWGITVPADALKDAASSDDICTVLMAHMP